MTIYNPLYLQNKGYRARFDRQFVGDLRVEGVIDPGSLKPTLTGGLGLSIAAGQCYIKGDTNANQGSYRFFMDAAVALTFVAPATNPRIDMVIARIQDSDEVGSGPDSATIEIVQGTPTAGANLSVNYAGAPLMASVPTAMPICFVLVPPSGAIASMREVRCYPGTLLDFDTFGPVSPVRAQLWQSVALGGGWVTTGGGHSLSYYLDQFGIVNVDIGATNAAPNPGGTAIVGASGITAGATMATVPPGFRPEKVQYGFLVVNGSSTIVSVVKIDKNGLFTPNTTISATQTLILIMSPYRAQPW